MLRGGVETKPLFFCNHQTTTDCSINKDGQINQAPRMLEWPQAHMSCIWKGKPCSNFDTDLAPNKHFCKTWSPNCEQIGYRGGESLNELFISGCCLPKIAVSQHCSDYNFWNYKYWTGVWKDFDYYEKLRTCVFDAGRCQNCSLEHKITKNYFYNICPTIQQLILIPRFHVGTNLVPW